MTSYRIALLFCVSLPLGSLPSFVAAQGEEEPLTSLPRLECFTFEDPEKGNLHFKIILAKPITSPKLDDPDQFVADDKSVFTVTSGTRQIAITESSGTQDSDIEDKGVLYAYEIIIPLDAYDRRGKYRITPAESVQAKLGPPVDCLGPLAAGDDQRRGWLANSSVTPKHATDGNGNLALGIDYDINLASTSLTGDVEAWSARLRSKGSLVFPSNGSDLDGLQTTIDFGWEYFDTPFLESAAEGGPDFESEDIGEMIAAMTKPRTVLDGLRIGALEPLAIRVALLGKHETQQDFAKHGIEVGLGAAATFPIPRMWDTPVLILPLAIFNLMNFDGQAVGAQQPYFALNVEWVAKGAGQTATGGTTESEQYFRGYAEFAWQGEYFAHDTWLYAKARLWIPFDPSNNVKRATKSVDHYVDVGLKIPFGIFRKRSDLTGPLVNAIATASESQGALAKDLVSVFNGEAKGPYVVVKYVTGNLPPAFKADQQVSLGLQLDF